MAEARFEPDWFSKPGDTLSALMQRQSLSAVEVAALIDRDVSIVRGILTGLTRIDSPIAEAIAGHIGGSVSFWHRRQEAYDRALNRAADKISPKEGADWLKQLPLKDISDFTGIPRPKERHEAVKTSMAYFGVTGPDDWQSRYTESLDRVAFRTSNAFLHHLGATAAWLRQGELEASMVTCKPWSSENLRDAISDLRRLSRAKTPTYFVPRLRKICAGAGVAVTFVQAPSGCRASGASRFVTADKAMVNLSLRHRSDDHLWFTIFHELGHLLLHGRDSTFVDGDLQGDDEREIEANEFAAETLIPNDRQDELQALPARREKVLRFAATLGIPPGIVVGQAQHKKIFGQGQLNYLKRRFSWEDFRKALAYPLK